MIDTAAIRAGHPSRTQQDALCDEVDRLRAVLAETERDRDREIATERAECDRTCADLRRQAFIRDEQHSKDMALLVALGDAAMAQVAVLAEALKDLVVNAPQTRGVTDHGCALCVTNAPFVDGKAWLCAWHRAGDALADLPAAAQAWLAAHPARDGVSTPTSMQSIDPAPLSSDTRKLLDLSRAPSTTPSTALLPCPFCGGEAVRVFSSRRGGDVGWCGVCDVDRPLTAWNRRAPVDGERRYTADEVRDALLGGVR
jgi:hypothetical protein